MSTKKSQAREIERIPVAEARRDFAGLLARAEHGTRINVTRYDRTLASIISKEDLERLTECEASHGARKPKVRLQRATSARKAPRAVRR